MVTPFLIAYYPSFGIIAEHFSAHEDDRICVSITCAPEIARIPSSDLVKTKRV